MSCDDLSKQVKSCLWLDGHLFNVSLSFLKSPPKACVHTKRINIGYLQDEFELHLLNLTENRVLVSFHRFRRNVSETLDNGYILRFYFIMIGFDEETKVAYMTHDQDHVCVTFTLSLNTLSKLNNPNFISELFVIAQMLEIKSLEASDKRKILVEDFISYVKSFLDPKRIESLGFILKRPGLKDVFTGRIPLLLMKRAMLTVVLMLSQFQKIADYMTAKSKDKDAPLPDFDVPRFLNYVARHDKKNPISNEHAIGQYCIAHVIGLDFYKCLTSDYLVTLLDKDFMVLDILEASISYQDEDLFEKAVSYFLRHFHEITRSEKFVALKTYKGYAVRLIIHATYMWVLKNDVYIPGWKQTTEL